MSKEGDTVSQDIFSYTNRDYEGARKEGIAQIPVLSKGKWTDLNSTDPGIIILDYVHALVDMINFYQDHQALETFIVTAKERSNIFRLAKQMSYSIRSAKGAICDVTFTNVLTYDHPIRIPKYTRVSTRNNISYLTMEDAYLPTRETQVIIPCSQGEIIERNYTGTGLSRFSNVERATNQTVHLSDRTIDTESVEVIDSIGRVWTPIEYIVFAKEAERVYQVDLNPDNTVTIKFGDGERGMIPAEGEVFTIRYILTRAEEGNVAANAIDDLNTLISDDGRYVEFTVFNAKASSGGTSAQSSSSIKELAPGVIKAQNRALTLSDFENLAKSIEGVADAKAYDKNVNPNLLHYVVQVLIIPNDSSGSIELLKNKVYKFLYSRIIPPNNLEILTPTYVDANIAVTVRKVNTGVVGRIEYAVIEAIKKYFEQKSGRIGEAFYPADLSATISNIPDIRYVVSITPNTPVEITQYESIRLGTVEVSVI